MAAKYLIVAGRFNELISKSLVDGAKQTLQDGDVDESDIYQVWVPGAYELPVVAAKAARSGKFAAVICLGAVIKGETAHFEYVSGPCASGLMNVSIETEVPIIFGVLTTNTVDQALNRAGLKLGNKGSESAHTAMQTIKSLAKLDSWSNR